MGKENSYVLRAKLVRKPKTGFSYGKTRKAVTSLLFDFKVGDEFLFDEVGNVKIEDEKVDIPVKINAHIYFGSGNGREKESKLCEFLIEIEKLFGIGTGRDKEAEERVKDMEDSGIIPLAYLTEFELKDFDN